MINIRTMVIVGILPSVITLFTIGGAAIYGYGQLSQRVQYESEFANSEIEKLWTQLASERDKTDDKVRNEVGTLGIHLSEDLTRMETTLNDDHSILLDLTKRAARIEGQVDSQERRITQIEGRLFEERLYEGRLLEERFYDERFY